MKEERNLIIGLDLCNQFTQVGFYNVKTMEAESIAESEEDEDRLIPTMLAVSEESKEWLFGNEAVACAKNGTGIVIDHLLERIKNQEMITVYECSFSRTMLMEKFLRKVLLLVKKRFPNDMVRHLVITMEQLSTDLSDVIYAALENLGIYKSRVTIQSHMQSFFYYALSQKKELWMNDVALFDYNVDGLFYYKLSIDRRNKPMVVTVYTKDCSDTMDYEMVRSQNETIGYSFVNLAKSVMYKQIISTLYLTGIGFEGDYVQSSMEQLCTGKRVFIGQNLYCHGACYAAMEICEPGKFRDYAFITEEMVPCTIMMKAYFNAKLSHVVLMQAATPWFEVDYDYNFILDDMTKFEFEITDVVRRDTRVEVIDLEELRFRKAKMTRIHMKIKCMESKKCVITLKDLGFGTFQPSSNQIWELVIQI